MAVKGEITGADAVAVARRKARYGHKTWVAWKGRDGETHVAPASTEAYKAALLAIGTKGRFSYYSSDGLSYAAGWQQGLVMFRNARAGYLF